MDSHFLAGILRPIFWLAVMLPLLVLIRWATVKYIKPRLNSRWQRRLFKSL